MARSSNGPIQHHWVAPHRQSSGSKNNLFSPISSQLAWAATPSENRGDISRNIRYPSIKELPLANSVGSSEEESQLDRNNIFNNIAVYFLRA